MKSLLKLKEFTDELETAESVLCTLGLSVESRDPYTEGHCERLAENASNLGRHLHLDEEEIIALRRGGYLHDLGKIAVPDEILKKGANLTAEEWQVMKRHPLMRVVRCDKLTLAALEATLHLYRDEERAIREIPTLAALTAPAELLAARADQGTSRRIRARICSSSRAARETSPR